MLDFFFIGPLVIGLVCWFKAPNEEWESLAKDFSKRWALSLIAMIAAAALGGITMPNGPESSESAWLIFVGIIWFYQECIFQHGNNLAVEIVYC